MTGLQIALQMLRYGILINCPRITRVRARLSGISDHDAPAWCDDAWVEIPRRRNRGGLSFFESVLHTGDLSSGTVNFSGVQCKISPIGCARSALSSTSICLSEME